MTVIRDWLQMIGLGEYAEVFERERIDVAAIPYLTEANLKDLGLPMGHRLKLLAAVRTLEGNPAASMPSETAASDALVEPSLKHAVGAERRQLTVLFCDLVGSSELSQRLDPEQYRELVQAYQAACGAVVSRFDGHIAQFLGDGLLVYFGYPKAHEDDAQRAARTGLQMIEAVSKLDTHYGTLSIRIGIHTGVVVVGDVGSGLLHEQLALGDTPNLAARLQALAPPNTVVLSAHTRELTGGSFEYRDLGAHVLKGFSEPVHAWQALAESGAESRFEAATRGALAPMVGRELEFAVLMHAWQRVKSGKGQVVLLCGEPGIGKSRILRALREGLAEEGVQPWQYQCSPYFANSALYPVIANLERALSFERDESPESKLDKVERFLEGYEQPKLDANLFARLLSLPGEARYGALSMTPQKQRDETVRALNDIIGTAARRQPLLMLFEDLHWADATTLESLEALLARLDHTPVLLAGTYRPEFRPTWIGQPAVTVLTLSRLDGEQTQAIATRVAGGMPLPQEIVEQIVTKTDGIPLFVEELTKAILESHLLKVTESGYELAGPLPAVAIPSTLRDSLMARLDRLVPVVKEVAQVGACIGREFSEELLSLISPPPQTQLRHALQQLVDSELVQRKRQPPNAIYSFKHALVQEAAYDSLLKTQRVQLHARIAKTVEQRFPEIADTEPELLAHHFAECGDLEHAARYWLRAGRNNVRRSANEQAIGHFERALGAIRGLPSSETSERLELEVQLAYTPALMAVAGFAEPRTLASADRAFALCEKYGFGGSALPVLFGQFSYRMASASLVAGLEIAARIARIGEDTDDAVARMVGQRALGFCNLWMGNLSVAQEAVETALRLSETVDHQVLAFQLGHDPAITAQAFYGTLKLKRGYPEQGRQLVATAIDRARKTGHGLTIAYVLYHRAQFDALAEDYIELNKTSTAFLEICERQRILQWLHLASFCRSLAVRYLGEDVDLPELDHLLREYMRGSLRLGLPLMMLLLADAYARDRAAGLADRWLDDAFAEIERTGQNWVLPEAYLLKGRLVGSEGRNEQECEQWLGRSLEVATKQQAKFSELRAATALAQLRLAQGRRADARALLQPAYEWFTEGHATKALQDAAALLAQLR